MNELVDFFKHEAHKNLSQIDWLKSLQENALETFANQGFPTRHDEQWRYTRLDSFLQNQFTPKKVFLNTEKKPQSDIPFGHEIIIQNGEMISFKDKELLPMGVIVEPLISAIKNYPQKIQPYLDKILQKQHAFQALNSAMMNNGLFIYIPEKIKLTTPIWLTHWQTEENNAVYLRHLIVVEAESSISVVEDYQGFNNCKYVTNTITEIHAAYNAQIKHYKIQRESKEAYHFGHLAIQEQAHSNVESHSLSVGGKLVRSDITVSLDESEASCFLNGVYAPGDGQHIDHHTLIEHNVQSCHSKQDYKGIMFGKSHAVFNGKILVSKGAQQTKAEQQNKNLLLSTGAEIDTKPQLEIYADDVICTHGATVGNLDEDALFYMASRGIEKKEATRYLVEAFAAENLRSDSDLGIWMNKVLNQLLDKVVDDE